MTKWDKSSTVICRSVVALLCVVRAEALQVKSELPASQLKSAMNKQAVRQGRPLQTSRSGVLTPIELARKALPSVVSVLVEGANGRLGRFGSGFFVRADVLATNYHVIETAATVSQITVKVAGKNEVYGVQEILGADEEKDLALLRVAGIKGRPLSLGTTRKVEIGEAVYAVGSPKGLEGTFSPGIVSSIRQDAGHYLIQITAPVSHGSSGGPVLSSGGEVIGIVTFLSEEGQNLNFAIPVKYLTSLITGSLVTDKQILADSYVDRGNRYVEQKSWVKALQAYKQAISTNRNYYVPYYWLGHVYHEMHRYAEAVQAYMQAIGIEPNDESLYFALGYAQEKLGRFSDAVEAYKQAIRIHPDASSYSSLGDAYAELGNYERAIESYKQAIQLATDAMLLAHFLGSLGDAFQKAGRDAEAIDAYKEAVRIDPTATPIAERYRNLGRLSRSLGQYSEAIAAYKEGIRIGGDTYSWLPPLDTELGLSYEALNRYAEAAEVYTAYAAKTKSEEESRRARASLGRAYYEMGSYDKAMAAYNEVITTKPDYAYAHHMLGRVYLKLGQAVEAKNEQSRALGILKRVLRANPKNAGAHLGLYIVYRDLGDKASAMIEYKTLERMTRENPDDLNDQLVFRRGEFYY